MKPYFYLSVLFFAFTTILPQSLNAQNKKEKATTVSIQGEKFLINGIPTYKDRSWNGFSIEGLLMNSRMVQGIFDDLNPQTAVKWKYEDTQQWDADRNTNEFIAAMESWHKKGLLAFTINLQGGSPLGYGNKGWINSAIDNKGALRPEYMKRLEKIMTKANDLGMAAIIGIYYFGQEYQLENETAVINGVDNTINWLFQKKYKNVLIEINNECDIKYTNAILKPERVHELIERVKSNKQNGYRYLVGTSFSGGKIPNENVVTAADFILLHGNGVHNPDGITDMVAKTKNVKGYKPKPILFNEDDHFNFEDPSNNFVNAVKSFASWGYFDFRMKGENFENGFQSIPVNWEISSPRKIGFFSKLEEITGGLK
ncbi:hypothetical protein [Flavobacterium algicola]|uniref:hypothetical protein n=1 Tax=Flavobacterium algicola TaxID=556529 RepID=UPI001EFC535C|nr:hypothetical protein [Flavobacterium algicola]MCG9792850.1 hypothetical protein [Flavobacterium algicola]